MTYENGANQNAAPDSMHDLRVPADRSGRPDVSAVRNDTEAVAIRFDTFCRAARDRITGVGAQQYVTDGVQRYDTLPLDALYQEAIEELLDVAAYAFMLTDRISKARDRLLAGGYDGM